MGLFAALLLVGSVWIMFVVGRWSLRCVGRLIPLTCLGIASIVAGLALFGTESDAGRQVRIGPWQLTGSLDLDDDPRLPAVASRMVSDFRERAVERERTREEVPKWALISLATILVISGALLAGRGRAAPGVVKGLTCLAFAASCFALVSFVRSTPRYMSGHERIVSVATDDAVPGNRREPAVPTPAKKPKRPVTRARRPTMRSTRPDVAADLTAELPPRAGEIPLDQEPPKESTSNSTVPLAIAPASVPQPDSQATPQPSADAPQPVASPQSPAIDSPASPVPPSEPAKVAEVPPLAARAAEASNKMPHEPVVVANAARPAWIEGPGRLVGSVYRTSAKSGLYVDVPECQRALDVAIRRETEHYINQYLGDGGAAAALRISPDYLRQHIVKAEFGEVIHSESVGPMQQIHALLEFDDDARADFQRRWRDAIVTTRLWYLGSAAGLVLGLLGVFYGYLRLDLKTGGTHKNQLRLAATLLALIVAAGVMLVNH